MPSQVSSTSDMVLYFLAIFVSPASVFIKRGCHADFWINLCLFVLGWIPGVIHAFWIISKYETPNTQSTHHRDAMAAPAPDYGTVNQQPVGGAAYGAPGPVKK